MLNGVYLSPDELISDELLLVPDRAYLGPDGLYVCPSQLKGLELGKDTWREAPHRYA